MYMFLDIAECTTNGHSEYTYKGKINHKTKIDKVKTKNSWTFFEFGVENILKYINHKFYKTQFAMSTICIEAFV